MVPQSLSALSLIREAMRSFCFPAHFIKGADFNEAAVGQEGNIRGFCREMINREDS